jgi:monomeric isocitrate dehydrogenase
VRRQPNTDIDVSQDFKMHMRIESFNAFTQAAGVAVETRDISLAGSI